MFSQKEVMVKDHKNFLGQRKILVWISIVLVETVFKVLSLYR